ncbi:MAG: GyrI-like domain-containing protein, partial [Planctomycetes bacterium]|nr:GyrI-like domain-containing protein [Planctomycetota bacterium]
MSEIAIKDVPPKTVMSLPFAGSYEQTREKLDHLMSWLLRIGHPWSDHPLGLYYDDPTKTPEDELRAEVCLPMEEECEPQEDIERKTLPAVTVAYALHEGPVAGISELYAEIFAWLQESDRTYAEDMPTREVFLKMRGQVDDPAQYVTEVQVPLAPIAESEEQDESQGIEG